jgi:hypothetical protein
VGRTIAAKTGLASPRGRPASAFFPAFSMRWGDFNGFRTKFDA